MNKAFMIEGAVAQYLKDEVQEAILAAALRVFAARGFRKATVAAIAAEAGISTGNVYRYFENKEALYQAVVPGDFAARFKRLVQQRVEAAAGAEDLAALGPETPWRVISEQGLRYAIENRLRVVVLLARSEGTEHEGYGEALAQALVKLALAHFKDLGSAARPAKATRLVLEQLYRNLVGMLVYVLESFEDEGDIRAAIEAYSRYHLHGLRALLGSPRAAQASDSSRS